MDKKTERYKEFITWVSNKLQKKLDKKIGYGQYGEIFDIGNGKVIKLTQSNVNVCTYLMNKNIDGICKIYSVGEIIVPKRFIVKQGNRYFIESEKSSFGSAYNTDISIYYIIMEKLNTKDAENDLYFIEGLLDYVLDENDIYKLLDYENKRMNSFYVLNKNSTNEKFISLVISKSYDYFDKKDINKYQELFIELVLVLRNIKKHFIWNDIHIDQFGYDKNNNLKAFDIDTENNMDYIQPKHVIKENILPFNSFK